MASRARLLLVTSLVALPCLAYTCPCFGHNGRDVGPADEEDARTGERTTTQGVLLDIYDGIEVSVDPKTGVRSYTQVGDITPNPARAKSAAASQAGTGPGIDYWVEKSFARNEGGGSYTPSAMYAPSTSMEVYDEGYSDYGYGGYYGGYLGYGYGGGGRGHGGGRPGRPGRPGDGEGGGGGRGDFGDRYSPPPGPPGGGVGSPPPYNSPGVGSPPPVLRYNNFRGRRG